MTQVVVEMTGDEARLFRSYQKVIAEQVKMEAGLGRVKRAGQGAGRAVESSMGRASGVMTSAIKQVGSYAAGLFGLTSILTTIVRSHQTWLQNMREIGAEAKKVGQEVIAFAALQAGGTKAQRVESARRLALQFGVADRGQAFDVVQALQSARGGEFGAGLSAARTVFAASQVGIPVATGQELEVFGAAQGAAPGEFLRKAFVAGQASARDPATLGAAGPGLTFFQDKDLAFSIAGVLAGSVGRDELKTFVKAAGIGLSDVSSLRGTFEQLGVAGASPLEKLRALRAAGVTTTEALDVAGLTEQRQQQALTTLVNQVPDVERILGEIQTRAVPGLFPRQRAGVEAELPGLRQTRQIELLEAAFRDETAFGARAGAAQEQEIEERIRGLALRRLGREQFGPFDLIDEAGRVNPARAAVSGIFGGQEAGAELFIEEQRIRGELEALSNAAVSATAALDRLAERAGGGPTLVPATEDR